MATEKKYSGVLVPRHDTAENWAKAINFIPKNSELIVYNADIGKTYDTTVTINNKTYQVQSSDKVRFKFGDGVSNVNALPFVETGGSIDGVTYEEMVKYVEQAELGDSFSVLLTEDKKTVRGKALVLSDVNPIQSDMKISLVSDNLVDSNVIKLTELWSAVSAALPEGKSRGYRLACTSDKYLGNGQIEIELPTYDTYYVHTYVESASDTDYLSVILYDDDTRVSRHHLTSLNSTYIVDSKELHVNKIVIYASTADLLYFDCYIGTSANPSSWNCPSDTNLYSITTASKNLSQRRVAELTATDYICELTLTAYSLDDSSQSVVIPVLVDGTDTSAQNYSIGPVTFPISKVELSDASNVKWACEQYIPARTSLMLQFFTSSIDSRSVDLNNIQLIVGDSATDKYDVCTATTVESDASHNIAIDTVQYPYTTLLVSKEADNAGYTIQVEYDCVQNEQTINDKITDAIASVNNTLEQLINDLE